MLPDFSILLFIYLFIYLIYYFTCHCMYHFYVPINILLSFDTQGAMVFLSQQTFFSFHFQNQTKKIPLVDIFLLTCVVRTNFFLHIEKNTISPVFNGPPLTMDCAEYQVLWYYVCYMSACTQTAPHSCNALWEKSPGYVWGHGIITINNTGATAPPLTNSF